MKLQVLQENLTHALNISSRFASSRAQLPVLSNILLSAEKNKLLVSSTNLEMSVSLSVGAKVEKQGKLTIPARTITDLISNLPSGQISLEAEKEQLKISAPNFKSSVSGMNASDFPSVPQKLDKSSLNLAKEDFLDALSLVLFAVSTDETRPILTGVLLIFEGGELVLVATDGFRLSKNKMKLAKGIKSFQVILPKVALSELSRLEDAEVVKFSYVGKENQVVFGLEETVLASRIIEGTFPDFEKIIPKDSNYKILLDKEELLRAVKLASVFARDAANVVKLKVGKDSLTLSAESATSGSQKAEVDAKVEGKGELEIAYNFRFLEDFLNAIKGEEVQLEFSSPSTPGVFRDPSDSNFLHLIMPVRTQG